MESGGSRYLNIDLEESMREFDKEEIRRFNMWLDIFQVKNCKCMTDRPTRSFIDFSYSIKTYNSIHL